MVKATVVTCFKAGGEPFEGFRWRSNENWFDNVVVAKKYIGPVHPVERKDVKAKAEAETKAESHAIRLFIVKTPR